jgi:exosortase
MESFEKITVKNRSIYSVLISTLFLVILIYHSTFIWLYQRYIADDTYYSHGFLIPVVTGVLIWFKRSQIINIKWEYNFWGLILVISALAIHFLSTLVEVFFVSGFSILLLVFGISLFLFGKKITQKIIFPISFLIFMFPLPLVAINAISFPMKMFVTKSAAFILHTFLNIPLKNEGFQIFFPNGSLTIENPCSGLRSFIVMLALGSIFAYLLKASMSKRISLFLLAIPIAIVSNMIRVILLCLGVYIYGNQITQGFFHDFSGYLVFVIAFGIFWLFWRKFQCRDSA